MTDPLSAILQTRFQHATPVSPELDINAALGRMAGRGSCRAFAASSIPGGVLDTLCAVALSSPTKSDLQQRDIVVISDADLKAEISNLLAGQAWIPAAPHLLIFCGNHRRQQRVHDMSGHAFANHHLDGFFNAAVDAAVALGAFVTAAEAAGFGCCPISTVRNHPKDIDRLLGLPDLVFPVAGLAVGYPETVPSISQRLPLHVTVHHDRWSDEGVEDAITAYDHQRRDRQPYATQRRSEALGHHDHYGWIEEKTRQYSVPERACFGDYIRGKGFSLD